MRPSSDSLGTVLSDIAASYLKAETTFPVPLSAVDLAASEREFKVRPVKRVGVSKIVRRMQQFFKLRGVYYDAQQPVLLYDRGDG
jgi:hypothetical protein